jgi:hypothetical protein
MAGEVLFGEQRFVRAGLIGSSFCWVWYVRAGKVGYVVARWGRVGYGQAGEVS